MTTLAENQDGQPSVTILMASYGRLELLKAAVDSALDQSYTNYQIVIVDDGSDKETIDWLRQIESHENKLTVHYQQHQGVAAARAYGLEKSETELICILDSDDILDRNAVAKLAQALQAHPGAELVYCDIREVRPGGKTAVQRYRQYSTVRAMTLATLLKPRVPFKHSGTMYRHRTAMDIGSYNTELPCKVDVDFYLKFLRAGHLPVLVNQALVDFRMHKDSVSLNRLQGIRVWLYLIDTYGPPSRTFRTAIKVTRVGAELLKRLYMEIPGRPHSR